MAGRKSKGKSTGKSAYIRSNLKKHAFQNGLFMKKTSAHIRAKKKFVENKYKMGHIFHIIYP